MNDVLKAYAGKFAKDTGKSFKIKYRSKKCNEQIKMKKHPDIKLKATATGACY
jgi:hypothetical protein